MTADEKIRAYKKLLRMKNFLVYFYPPLFVIAWASIINIFNLNNPMIIMTVMIIIISPVHLWFIKKNKCPWCGQPFFLYNPDGSTNTQENIFTQNRCVNCKNPFNTNVK